MNRLLKAIGIVIAAILLSSSTPSAVDNPEIIQWRADDNGVFLNSLFVGVLGREPTPDEFNFFINRDLGRRMGRGEALWSLLASQEYRSIFGSPQGPYHIRWESREITTDERGLWFCHCYFFTKDPALTGGHPAVMQYLGVRTPWDSYNFSVARTVTRMFAVYDGDVCPAVDCGLNAGDVAVLFPPEDVDDTPNPAQNLVRDPHFSNFLSGGAWGRGVLYDEHGIWWNSRNARSSARTVTLQGGNIPTALHIRNQSAIAPHVFGTTAQRISVIPGRTYEIGFFWKATQLASNGAITITVDPKWEVRPINMPAGSYDWRRFTGTFTATQNYIDLRIISQDRGEVYITDMVLRQLN